MRSIALAALLCAAPPSALAQSSDLRTLSVDGISLGGETSMRVERRRLTLACGACAGFVAVDVLLDTTRDGTEQRYRAGTTTPAMLEAQCQARLPECTLARWDLPPAVGWHTRWGLSADTNGSTIVLLNEGERLTVRSLAPDVETAAANAERVANRLAPQVFAD